MKESECRNPACEGGFVTVSQAIAGQAAVVKRCPDCERRRKVEKLSALYQRAGLPEVLKGYRLPSDRAAALIPVETDQPGWGEIEEHTARLPEIIELGVNFIFVGPVGTGKSQAGAIMIAKAARLGMTAIAISVPDWLMLVQNDYGEANGISELRHIERLTAADLLLLDDVGADLPKDTTTASRLLSRVIAKRYDSMRPTIITTNLPAREDLNKLGELLGGRAYDRFAENAVKIVFDGKNYRQEKQRTRLTAYLTKAQAAD